ncbi:Dihydroorotase [bioreactor metagenome]|uniref:Dihydroorotase n=1 Tax=bioreactor metagenome TaxID=1076179 RepID=A0A645BYW1_9ZZZZ
MQYNTYAKVIPPLRTKSDIEAIVNGIADGTIDVISSGHAPTRIEYKQREFDTAAYGISAFETAFALSWTKLVKTGAITPGELIKKLSSNPDNILGFESKGKIKAGYDADLTIAECKKEYILDASKFLSKAKFTPANGMNVTGRILHTIVGGKTVF